MRLMIDLAERALLPDSLIRFGIRRLLADRKNSLYSKDLEGREEDLWKFIHSMRNSAIAVETEKANEQHYELPAEFFEIVLGKHLKYSSGYWPQSTISLDDSELRMLELMAERADLKEDQKVLDLGCGWGSFSLWAAQKYPSSEFLAVSNSRIQREFIERRIENLSLRNLRVETQNVRDLKLDRQFDRIVSVEMFEHMRNWEKLLTLLSKHLSPDGKMFVHIFTHRDWPYLFETEGEHNWMGREFFSGGMMPSHRLFSLIQSPLKLEQAWVVNGGHYGRTSRAWLEKLDSRKDEVNRIFKTCYGDQSKKWLQRWRIFFMACEELFFYEKGEEWLVSHYRFSKGRD